MLSSPTRVPGTHRCQHSHTRFIPVSPCQVRVIVLMECHSLNANIQCDLVWFITLWWMHKVCVCQTSRKETAAGVIVYCHAAYFSYFLHPSLCFQLPFSACLSFPYHTRPKTLFVCFVAEWAVGHPRLFLSWFVTEALEEQKWLSVLPTSLHFQWYPIIIFVVSFRSQFAHILSKESVTLCMKLSNKPVMNIYTDVKLSTLIRHWLASAFAAVSLFHPLYFQ